MADFSYTMRGTCAHTVYFELDEDQCVHDVQFLGGCNGNLKGVGALVEDMPAEEAIQRLSGITCGPKSTSCPDQLARALRAALEQ